MRMIDKRYPIGKFEKPSVRSKVQLESWISDIQQLPEKLNKVLENLTAQQLDTPYRDEGWTARQVIHHIADSHMNSYIRFKWALTEDEPVIKAYNEQKWAEEKDAKEMDIRPSVEIIKSLHHRWSYMLTNLTDQQLKRGFIHPENKQRWELNWTIGMYAWHGNHHLEHIKMCKTKI
jgi:hypothetical protein